MDKPRWVPVKRYIPDCSIHSSNEIAFMRETTKGTHVDYSDYQALLVVNDIAKARIFVLEEERQLLSARNRRLSYALCNRMPLAFWWRFMFRTFILGGRDE